MPVIKLTRGYITEVDDEDYEELSKYNWQVFTPSKNVIYVVRGVWNNERQNNDKQYMHRVIMKINDPLVIVDHRDGNGLNNCRSNLRITDRTGNNRNSKLRRNNTSGYKGVSWFKRDKCWTVRINIRGKAKNLGYFTDPIEAACIYDEAARLEHGKFARLNFPLPGEQSAR